VRAYDIAKRAGLHYVYTGNVSDRRHESTYCPGCGQVLIERDRYQLGAYNIRNGRCGQCGAAVAGHFEDQPGTWGARRQPVRIGSYARPGIPAQSAAAAAAPLAVAVAPPPAAEPAPAPAGRPELTPQQEQRVFHAACLQVATTVRSETCPSLPEILGDVAATAVYGAFVTLKRGGRLRSCCGFMGQSVPLAQAVQYAAIRSAKDDPRFPPISRSELEHLDVDVWLLWGPQLVTARGEDRVGVVVIGKHGLQIARGNARGLLLPGVAVEHNFDARQFLEQVCLKAGLAPNDWKRDDTQLMIFEGYSIQAPIEREVLSAEEEPAAGGPSRAELVALADFCRSNLVAFAVGATPSYYLPGGFDASVCGASISIGPPGNPGNLEASSLSLRADRPLQSTLYNLAETLAKALRERGADLRTLGRGDVGLTILRDPAMHGTADQPDLGGLDPRRRALVVVDASRSVWLFDPSRTAGQLAADALALGAFPTPAAASVFSMAAVSTVPRAAAAFLPRGGAGPALRMPAVAGSFYPARPEEIQGLLAKFLPQPPVAEPWPAAMVPHAGWVYSGRLAAATLSRIKIPEQVIVFCPKHRPGGAEWAVAPHETWSFPGGKMAADPELAKRLAGGIPGLELDAVSHQQEHAVEVHLPILARLAPDARVTGIAVGRSDLPGLLRFAEGLAEVLKGLPQRPLLVISSDMNHYASDADTRRLDRLALDSMQALDPARLFETVTQNRISMCGMGAAVIVMQALRQLDGLRRFELVGYTTSAEASGDTNRCVGYAGVLLG
jgi:AmmeMemoRadiSam system protein B/AmmeMemoRadiSam system protein A